jgi:uncharacterized protein involved in exopolysaccharide biosynthesis
MVDISSPLLRVTIGGVDSYIRAIEWTLEKLFGVTSPFRISSVGNRDQRIAKIDEARANLEDALNALGELKREAETNKAELQDALNQLDRTKAGHAAEAAQLQQIRAIAEADVATFRRMAGIRPARERLIGFIGGVVASLVAAGLWKLAELILR